MSKRASIAAAIAIAAVASDEARAHAVERSAPAPVPAATFERYSVTDHPSGRTTAWVTVVAVPRATSAAVSLDGGKTWEQMLRGRQRDGAVRFRAGHVDVPDALDRTFWHRPRVMTCTAQMRCIVVIRAYLVPMVEVM